MTVIIDDVAVRRALQGVLDDAAGSLPPITHQAISARPTANALAIVTRLFRRGEWLHSAAAQAAGFFHIEVWSPKNIGSASAEVTASRIKELYTPDTLLNELVSVQGVSMLSGAPDDTEAFWVVPVQVDWSVCKIIG